MDDNGYCDLHDSYWNDEFTCECHVLAKHDYLQAAEDSETDYQIELWKERMRG
jgi:hypothetical protein